MRKLCPATPIVLVDIATHPRWNSKAELNSTFDVKDGMLFAKENSADTYIQCSINVEDIDAVFAAAMRIVLQAKKFQPALDQRPQSTLDKLKQFLTHRGPDVQ